MSKTTPKYGTSYPLRIGKTIRNGARSLLSLKFTHVPNNTQLKKPGCLRREDDKCTVSLSTTDGQGAIFKGTRSTTTTVADYALVFANGAMWLERADDVFTGMRHTFGDGMDVPVGEGDDVRGDPDSWMVEESGSPITPEGNEGEEVRRPPTHGGKFIATKTVPGTVRKASQSSSEEEDSDNNSDDSDSECSDSDSSSRWTDGTTDEDD